MASELKRFLGARIADFFEDDYAEYTAEDIHANIGGDEVDDVPLELVKARLDGWVADKIMSKVGDKYSWIHDDE